MGTLVSAFETASSDIVDLPAAAAPKVKRPVTCAEVFSITPELGSAGCRRLPRHKGDHRPTLTLAATRKAARVATARAAGKVAGKRSGKVAGKTRLTPAQRKRDKYADIAVRMAAGTITPAEALAEVSSLA